MPTESEPAPQGRQPAGSAAQPGAGAWRLLARAIAPDARPFRWALVWLLLAGGLEALGPLLGKRFIDGQLMSGQVDPAAASLLLGGMLLAGWVSSLLRYATLVRLAGIAMRSVRRLREWVHEHVLNLPMAYFDEANTGQLVSRITNDTEQIRQLYVKVLFEVLQGLAILGGAVAAMAWLDWRLMLIVLTLVPVMTGIVWTYRRLSAAAVQRTRELRSEINAQMAESIAGMVILQATGSAHRFLARFTDINRQYHGSRLREIRANAWLLRPALDLVNILLIIAAIAAFGNLHGQALQIGLLYAFIAYIGRVVEPLIQITQQFSMLQQSLVAASRLDELLAENRAPTPTGGRRMSDASLVLDGVGFGYAPHEPVIRHLNLRIEPGSFVGIVGHTGAGKSTLLALLLRFHAPWQGRIELGGVPIGEIDDVDFRRDIGVVPQEPFVLASSARDNIDMDRGLPLARIEAAAREAGIHEMILALERGYDTPLGERGARLSAGQKQLLAVARALAGDPKILLLDEATSRVDSDTEQQVSRAIRALHGQVTVIAIAHRLSTVRAADEIIVLNHGELVERGDHDTLMRADDGLYRRLVQLQRLGP